MDYISYHAHSSFVSWLSSVFIFKQTTTSPAEGYRSKPHASVPFVYGHQCIKNASRAPDFPLHKKRSITSHLRATIGPYLFLPLAQSLIRQSLWTLSLPKEIRWTAGHLIATIHCIRTRKTSHCSITKKKPTLKHPLSRWSVPAYRNRSLFRSSRETAFSFTRSGFCPSV